MISHPVKLAPIAPKQYYEVKEPFNVAGLLKSPMAIMMLVSFGLMFMMNRMPKPDKKELAEMNKQMGAASLPSFLTGGAPQ